MGPRTVDQALNALDGMYQIVEKEMVVKGHYVTGVVDEALASAGAICNGRKYCAIGSLWAGHGVRAVKDPWAEWGWNLPGVNEGAERDEFLENRHGLRLAYNSLNEAATEWAEKNIASPRGREDVLETFNAPIEALFEAEDDFKEDYDFELGRPELLEIIERAENIVREKSMAVAA